MADFYMVRSAKFNVLDWAEISDRGIPLLERSTRKESGHEVMCERGQPRDLSSKAQHIGKSKRTFISAPTIAYSYRRMLSS